MYNNELFQNILFDNGSLFSSTLFTGGQGAEPLSYPGVLFDGTNDYLTRGGDFTGAADTTTGVIAFAVKFEGGDTSRQRVFADSLGRLYIRRMETASFGNGFQLVLASAAGVNLVNGIGTIGVTADGSWHTVLVAWDFSSATTTNNWAYVYIDDVQDVADTDVANAAVDSTQSNWYVGQSPANNERLNGCLGPIFYHTGVSLNPTVEANRRKLWLADGTQANWGANGSTVLGVQPLLYLEGEDGTVAQYIANRGSGGGMTENGALEVC